MLSLTAEDRLRLEKSGLIKPPAQAGARPAPARRPLTIDEAARAWHIAMKKAQDAFRELRAAEAAYTEARHYRPNQGRPRAITGDPYAVPAKATA